MLKNIIACNKLRFVVMSSKGSAFYAVRRGRSPGVFNTWSECEAQVKGFKNAAYKKFPTEDAAWSFVNGETSTAGSSSLNKVHAISNKRKNSETAGEKNSKSQKSSSDSALEKIAESDGTVVVYTDGASSCNGFSGAQAGIGVYWGPNHPLNTSKRLPGRQTNNRAEIYAAVHALRQAKEIGAKNVKLYTDSKFLIQGITEWIHKWKRNGWKLSGTGGPVINKEDFIELDEARKGLNVDWLYIKAHDNNYGNVQADALAVAGAQKSEEEN